MDQEENEVIVSDKRTMYRMLDAGEFGNTIPRWYSVRAWKDSGYRSDLWAIRSMTPGNWACSGLNIPTDNVEWLYYNWNKSGEGSEISPMVDHMLTARFHAHYGCSGLIVWVVEGHREVPWRKAFETVSAHYEGVNARLVLRKYLNENSIDDLDIVLDKYQDHVVELTALDRCFGTVPHRNAVVWEVRRY